MEIVKRERDTISAAISDAKVTNVTAPPYRAKPTASSITPEVSVAIETFFKGFVAVFSDQACFNFVLDVFTRLIKDAQPKWNLVLLAMLTSFLQHSPLASGPTQFLELSELLVVANQSARKEEARLAKEAALAMLQRTEFCGDTPLAFNFLRRLGSRPSLPKGALRSQTSWEEEVSDWKSRMVTQTIPLLTRMFLHPVGDRSDKALTDGSVLPDRPVDFEPLPVPARGRPMRTPIAPPLPKAPPTVVAVSGVMLEEENRVYTPEPVEAESEAELPISQAAPSSTPSVRSPMSSSVNPNIASPNTPDDAMTPACNHYNYDDEFNNSPEAARESNPTYNITDANKISYGGLEEEDEEDDDEEEEVSVSRQEVDDNDVHPSSPGLPSPGKWEVPPTPALRSPSARRHGEDGAFSPTKSVMLVECSSQQAPSPQPLTSNNRDRFERAHSSLKVPGGENQPPVPPPMPSNHPPMPPSRGPPSVPYKFNSMRNPATPQAQRHR
jgi:hypothetical protein